MRNKKGKKETRYFFRFPFFHYASCLLLSFLISQKRRLPFNNKETRPPAHNPRSNPFNPIALAINTFSP